MGADTGAHPLPVALDRQDVLADVPALPILALAGVGGRVGAVADAAHAFEALAGRLDEVDTLAARVDAPTNDQQLGPLVSIYIVP